MCVGNTVMSGAPKIGVRGKRKSAVAAAMIAGVIVLAAGCTTTQVDETMPPYASISDEGRDPPKPPPSQDSDSPGIMSRIGSAILQLFW
jgi:hypothetical protein